MSNKKIRKLTPAILKQAKRNKKSSAQLEIKYLNETKERQRKLVREFRKLYLVRQKLKKNLIKRL